MTLFQVLLVLHILAAMIWIGGAIVGVLLGMLLARSDDSGATLGRYCTAFATVAGPAFGGSGGIVLLTGIWMVAKEGYPEFSMLWVIIGLVGWLVSTILGAAVVGKAWFGVGQRLNAGESLEAVAPLREKAVRLAWVDIAIRIAVVVVMVWQPT